MNMRLLRASLVLVLVARTAQANVWDRAIDKHEVVVTDDYENQLSKGDEASLAANSRSVSLAQIRKDVDAAADWYRAAARTRPKAAEPHFRIGALFNSFFFDCSPGMIHPPTCTGFNAPKARETVEAWDAFEALSPLDPRVNELLLQRAILRTKLIATAPKEARLLQTALRDYEAILDRADGLMQGRAHLVLGNLAETYMMLGQLEESIEVYKQAVRAGATSSTIYGLAVALDRDDRGAQALSIIRDQGVKEYEEFELAFQSGLVFYVPAGEEQYYMGLIDEAFGNSDAAIEHWKLYIRSGAHPQYQPRAKLHLDALLAKKNMRWRPPAPPDPFRDIR